MDSSSQKPNLLDLDQAAMRNFFTQLGEKPFHGTQVIQWIHQRGKLQFDQMTDLSKSLRLNLAEHANIRIPEIVRDYAASDGTRKWLMKLEDGNCIETVFIPEEDRGTLCVSSQVGCMLNCTFCSTARQGFNRNLTVGEIIGQLWVAAEAIGQHGSERIITNVVMMGMGEPLLNYDNVVSAMKLMLDDHAYGLSRRRVTLSTAGVVPAIDRLASDLPVSLAVSLHAPNDELRNKLVPINRKYPIDELLAACRRYVGDDSRRRITFEYVMLQEVNDSEQRARELARLLADVPAKVNLIPFNPFPQSEYTRSSREVIDRFRDILMNKGIVTVTRKTRGDDIDAACGQLAGRVQDRTARSRRLAIHKG